MLGEHMTERRPNQYRPSAGTPRHTATGSRASTPRHAAPGSHAARPTSTRRTTYVKPATRSSYLTEDPRTRRTQARRRPQQHQQRRRFPIALLVALVLVLLGGSAIYGVTRLIGGGNASDGSSKSSTEQVQEQTISEQTQTATGDPGEIVIGVNGNERTVVLKGEDYLEAGAHAAEPTDGVLNNQIKTAGEVDTSKAGTYTITYSVEDSTGHRASVERTVEVVDTMDKQKDGIPVLMYHDVHEDGDTSQAYDANNISDASLDGQLSYLTQNGYYFASFQEVKAFVEGKHSLPAKSIVLTFDDATEGFLKHGIPVLEKYKVPATSFCIGMYDQNNSVNFRSRYVEYESHSYKMHQAGGTSGHGGLMTAMTTSEILEDLQKEAGILQANNAFAYPFGDVPEAGVEAVKQAGIACAFTTVNGWAKIGDDPEQLARVRINAGVDLNSYVASVTN